MKLTDVQSVGNLLEGTGYTDVNIGYTRQWGYTLTCISPSGEHCVFGSDAVYEWCLEHPEQKRLRGLPEPLASSGN